MNEWVKMPSNWIRFNSGLKKFTRKEMSNAISALIVYIALILRANQEPNEEFMEPGYVSISYTVLQNMTGLSRALISRGLKKLVEENLINIHKNNKKNQYEVLEYDPSKGWGKLPKKYLYKESTGGEITFLNHFKLRHLTELNALKLYLLFIAFRDNKRNSARISYSKITEYTGVYPNNIRDALSLLVNLSLIQIDREVLPSDDKNPPNEYRIRGIDSRNHLGTQTPINH